MVLLVKEQKDRRNSRKNMPAITPTHTYTPNTFTHTTHRHTYHTHTRKPSYKAKMRPRFGVRERKRKREKEEPYNVSRTAILLGSWRIRVI